MAAGRYEELQRSGLGHSRAPQLADPARGEAALFGHLHIVFTSSPYMLALSKKRLRPVTIGSSLVSDRMRPHRGGTLKGRGPRPIGRDISAETLTMRDARRHYRMTKGARVRRLVSLVALALLAVAAIGSAQAPPATADTGGVGAALIPLKLPFYPNDAFGSYEPTVTADGNTIYFARFSTVGDASVLGNSTDLFVTHRIRRSGGWPGVRGRVDEARAASRHRQQPLYRPGATDLPQTARRCTG